MATKGKKRYVAPKADEKAFKTQKEFLDSLKVVPRESLADYNRKCAHCWKFYGESDPGLQNAEEPVKFRCGHAFGTKL